MKKLLAALFLAVVGVLAIHRAVDDHFEGQTQTVPPPVFEVEIHVYPEGEHYLLKGQVHDLATGALLLAPEFTFGPEEDVLITSEAGREPFVVVEASGRDGVIHHGVTIHCANGRVLERFSSSVVIP